MSLNIRALKDAVARWQTYEDRGITPQHGWGKGGDGNSCALGDIAHYENLNTGMNVPEQETMVGDYLGFGRQLNWKYMIAVNRNSNMAIALSSKYCEHFTSEAELLASINDGWNRWPIEEVQRLIAWEEASIKADNIADVEQPIFV